MKEMPKEAAEELKEKLEKVGATVNLVWNHKINKANRIGNLQQRKVFSMHLFKITFHFPENVQN